ncbi:conserved protein of unknown function [Rhodovastum atsumiense]|uniref:ABM domain-containing protein n=1 Tax=Rhodovastum atsumiense TaxID=504468 RepID=A0A5M6ITR3_9PROT|nr:hypothetical protein [Rhodovastum atsumiense]KAA5611713.1 hypothetical protein F1189_13020 [Rhodovastum atsumiense]CAH2604290.1 conserved protein of unknown function [Rhodovastum atsumiense]
MYVSIRSYEVQEGCVAEFARRVQRSFVPYLNTTPGFQAYYMVDSKEGRLTTISLFDTYEAALASQARASEFVKANLAEFVSGTPSVATGETVLCIHGPSNH